MLAIVKSAVTLGVDGHPVQVEVHTRPGLPSFSVVGAPDATCRELRDRVRAAMLSSGLTWPSARVTVNIAPATTTLRLSSLLDLPIALGVLAASEQIPATALDGVAALGELGLDGTVRLTAGLLPALFAAGDTCDGALIVPTAMVGRLPRPLGERLQFADALADIADHLIQEARS